MKTTTLNDNWLILTRQLLYNKSENTQVPDIQRLDD